MRYRDLCALGSTSTDRGLPPPGGTEYASIFRIVARLPRYGTPRGTGKADVPKTVVLGTPRMPARELHALHAP